MPTPTLGIDMSQASFVAVLRWDRQRLIKESFPNQPRGFRQLALWCKRHGAGGSLRIAVESTNTYSEALLHWLHARGHGVFLLNPEHVAHYARSLGQRNKTDPADAATIAAFLASHDPTPWHPPAPEQKTLRSLTRARHQLVRLCTEVSNQLKTAEAPARAHLQPVLTQLRAQLKAILQSIREHLRAFPLLQAQVARLMTLKGAGLVTAATAIAELPPITPQTDPRTMSSWAGLTPRRRQSGKTELRARLSRNGNRYLRDALYLPALVAKRHNPLLRAFAERLKAKGKTNPAILGAIAHKMLRIFIGLLKSNRDFDPNWSPQKT